MTLHSSTYISLFNLFKYFSLFFSKLDVHRPLAEDFNTLTLPIYNQGKPTFLEIDLRRLPCLALTTVLETLSTRTIFVFHTFII
jgi:hypothetical protein